MIAELGGGVCKGGLRVAKTIAAVGAGELAVDVDGNAGFAGARARIVSGENAGGCGGNDQSFLFREEAKRDAERFVLGGEERRSAVKRINEDAAEGGCGHSEKMASAHGWESSRRANKARTRFLFGEVSETARVREEDGQRGEACAMV